MPKPNPTDISSDFRTIKPVVVKKTSSFYNRYIDPNEVAEEGYNNYKGDDYNNGYINNDDKGRPREGNGKVGEDKEFDDDNTHKVYVSRLPLKWSERHLEKHFKSCFGDVTEVTLKWDKENDCSRGYGFVTFGTKEAMNNAIEQGSIHAKHKTIKIAAITRDDNNQGRGRDIGNCYLWMKFACVKGNDCKFKHDGPGGCITVSAPGEGKTKKCVSFKSKGKCSKGDNCPFLHISSIKNKDNNISNIELKSEIKKDKVKGSCDNFKKGKCRKGDKCKYIHEIVNNSSNNNVEDNNLNKRKRIDGNVLVKKMKELEKNTIKLVNNSSNTSSSNDSSDSDDDKNK